MVHAWQGAWTFPFSSVQTCSRSTQPPMQWVQWTLSPEVEQPHVRLGLRSRMNGPTPLLPHMSLWHKQTT